jgi:diguanylate cyclase (GGDEF)-like protein
VADAGAADTALVRNGRVGWSPGALPWRPGAGVDPSQRILLIDGGRESLVPLELVSYEVGAVVHHARTLADALRYALKFCYDALLVDAGSGGETPIALLEQLRSLQPTAGILLCGDGLRFPEGFTLGGNLLGSFRSPWDRQEMATALRRAFELSRARRTPRPRFPAVRVSFERVLLIANATDFRRVERMSRLWFVPGGLVHATLLDEALLLLSQQNFDLVLTELALPDACGLDPVVRIRRLSEQIPIVVLTSIEDTALLDQVLQAGAQDVLLKPEVDRKLLFRAMCHSRLRQRAQLQLSHGALHDELTSLAKRTLLQQRISNALARSRRIGNTFAVMYIDLDHFKCINDTYGHDVGDAVLVAVSQRLKSAVREYDTVARLGGDEFAILLDSIEQPGEAETVAQRVLASLMPPVQVDQREIDVTASMGISVFPDGGSGADDLLRNADQAMYSAKRAGRNTYSITPPVEPREMPPPISARRSVPASGASSSPAVSGIAKVSSSYPSRVANDALDE